MTPKKRIGGDRRCAHKKRDGSPCGNPAVTGYRVCRFHGAGSPKKGKPGGRPPTHGLASRRLAVTLADRTAALRADPALADGLTDIARVRALVERAEELLSGEEASYLKTLGKNPVNDSVMRGRLLTWYECLVKLSAETVATIDRYYAALEKRAGGVALDAVRAGMVAIVKVLDESLTDEAQKKAINDRIAVAFERIVVASPQHAG